MNAAVTEHDAPIRPRRMSLALLLSLGATGLGQVYCGRLGKGLALLLAGLALFPALFLTAPLASGTALPLLLAAFLFAYLGLFFYALIDAAVLARRSSKAYELKPFNQWWVYVLIMGLTVVCATSCTGYIRADVVEPFNIPSASMAPAILPGDYVLCDKRAYVDGPPRRGDLVIFQNPNNRSMSMLKRIIALPGDIIEVRSGRAWVNGQDLSQAATAEAVSIAEPVPAIQGLGVTERNGQASYVVLVSENDGPGRDLAPFTVPNGHCFVLGDNRPESMDSRDFGPVPLSDLQGRVESIYLPAASWSRFGAID